MSLKSLFKMFRKAAPVIVANAPAVINAVKEVRRAARKQRKDKEDGVQSPPPIEAS